MPSPTSLDDEELLLYWRRRFGVIPARQVVSTVPSRVAALLIPKREIRDVAWKRDRLRWMGEERPEYPHDGFIRAMKEYALLALLDPTNIPEAHAWSLALGVGYGSGMGVTLLKGLILGPPILATIDPQHRWEGGLDEYPEYKAMVNTIAYTHPELPREIIMGGGSWGSVV
jgi:hypothetical protein